MNEENTLKFKGIPQKINIISNRISYSTYPAPEDEIEQHLSLTSEGEVSFSAYIFGKDNEPYPLAKTENFQLDKNAATELLNTIAAYFSHENDRIITTDIGNWILEIINSEGKIYKYTGSLNAGLTLNDIDLSNLCRTTLNRPDLYIFDGNYKSDQINRIMVSYHRVSKMKLPSLPEVAAWQDAIWDYQEQLIIDRASETIEHIQYIGTDCKVSRKYEIAEGVASLLDDFDYDELFLNIVGNPEDAVGKANETRDYEISIDYQKKPQRLIKGSFDKNGLPEDFGEFVQTVFDFLRVYGWGEIFAPYIYGQVKRRKSDYIFCSVNFDDGYKSYYYLTEDDSIEVGDLVVVPAGKDNQEKIVEVVDINYYSENDAPLPIAKTKYIIRKYQDEQKQAPSSEN